MDIEKCGREGCNPVLQTRGEMKPEDHHMQFNRYEAAGEFMAEHGVALPLKEFREDAFEVENLGAEHNSDIRISCSKCGQAIGWARRDIEEFHRHGDADYRRRIVTRDGNMDNVRNRWNEMVK
jgi:hypothetical protein